MISRLKLGINIDHVATIRNARGGMHPDPLKAALIAQNAGADGAVVAGKLLEQKDIAVGYNAQTGVYENLIKAGVIDPAKVVRAALQDAASVSGLLITTEAMVAEKPEKKEPAPMPGGGDMGGMGGMGGMGF